ncbi:MAG: hypothetical protein SGCHY_004083, partial [Lobulomycetales sp.]
MENFLTILCAEQNVRHAAEKFASILEQCQQRLFKKNRSITACKSMQDGLAQPVGCRGTALDEILKGKGLISVAVLVKDTRRLWNSDSAKPKLDG